MEGVQWKESPAHKDANQEEKDETEVESERFLKEFSATRLLDLSWGWSLPQGEPNAARAMKFGVANIFHVNVTGQQKCREYEEVNVHVLKIL